MKTKVNAKQRREAEEQRRKDSFSQGRPTPGQTQPAKQVSPKPAPVPIQSLPEKSPEEETREFLEYLERYGTKGAKEVQAQRTTRNPSTMAAIPKLNLEEGMPYVEAAIDRLHMGIQEMRVSRVKIVKLIHGYGSTGRGGKIGISVREELTVLKRRKLIRDFIPGEDFGPTDVASRTLVEQNKSVSKDQDYGRMNHGITIVVLY